MPGSSSLVAPKTYNPHDHPSRMRKLWPVVQQINPAQDVRAPTPDKFSDEASDCRGFLHQCSLAFNRSPQFYPHDYAKISFILGLLTSKVLRWVKARFDDPTDFECSFSEFIDEFKLVFGHAADQINISLNLWVLSRGKDQLWNFLLSPGLLQQLPIGTVPLLKAHFFTH